MSIFDKYIYTHGQVIFNHIHNFGMFCFNQIYRVQILTKAFYKQNNKQSSKQIEASPLAQNHLVAHRGFRAHPKWVENTLEAFEHAWNYTPHLEFDLRLTKDGQLVIHHDDNLQKLWAIDCLIEHTELRELKKLAPQIPTWDELVLAEQNRFFRSSTKATWFVEIKEETNLNHLDRLIEELKTKVDRIAQSSLSQRQMIDIHLITLSPEIMQKLKEKFPQLRRSIVYLLNPQKALDYLETDKDSGILGWYFTQPQIKNRSIGVGFLNHTSSLQNYLRRVNLEANSNQKIDWVFSDRVDRSQ